MKLNEYLTNPMGKGSTANQARLIREDLDKRLDALIRARKISYETFITRTNVVYYLFKIGSETKRENTYDILLEFKTDNPTIVNVAMTVKDYDISFFSNCPSFVFSFANVFNEHGLLIPGTESKYSSIVLSEKPKEKNPQGIINFEKSLYFACKYLERNSELLTRAFIDNRAKTLSPSDIIGKLRKFTIIQKEIKAEEERLKPTKSRSEERLRTKPTEKIKDSSRIQKIKKVNKIKPSAKNKTIKKI